MESAKIARCSYRAVTVIIALFEHSKYEDISNEICLRFKELKVGSFKLSYSLPEHSHCMLQTDLDVHMMLICSSMMKMNFVDISVKGLVSSNKEDDGQNHEDSHHVASNHEVSNRTAPLSCTLESSSAIDNNEHLGNSRLQGGNTYLPQGWKEYINHVGQKFEGGISEFRNKLCKYAIEMGFRFVYVKNDKERVIAECFKKISDGCNWRVCASMCRVNGFVYITILDNIYTCTIVSHKEKSKMMRSRVVSSVLLDKIREKPSIKPVDIVKDFKENYGLDISYQKAWYGKELAKTKVHGDESLSYSQLVWYSDASMSTNPGSHCVLKSDPETNRFRRLFVCYGACIEGFRWCRPMLFIDATILKSKYKGQLIGATGKDGNQGFFLLAFAILDSENEENWSWFFENLAKVLTPQGTITFVSNHNKGLVKAVSKIFPASHHAFWLNHLKQILLSKYPVTSGKFFQDRIVDLFMKCAYARTEAAFEFHIRALGDEGGALVKTFLEDQPKENWANVHFKGNRYGEMCNNVSESFHSWILELYAFPICQMVDGIRIKLMVMMAERSHEAEQWCSVLCPEMEKTLKEMVAQHWTIGF